MGIVLINPGSHVRGGTAEQALENARDWHRRMIEQGFTDVVLDEVPRQGPPQYGSDRWTFAFRHTLTGREAELMIHGLSEGECGECGIFRPRVYWNGSSCSDPKWEDFLTDGFELAIRPKG